MLEMQRSPGINYCLRSPLRKAAIYFGRQVETPDVAQAVIDWESLDAHEAFTASEAYGPFIATLATMLAGPPQIFHLSISAEYPASLPLSAPVTEVLSLYLEPSHENAAFDANWKTFYERAHEVVSTVALAGGWSIEPHKHKDLAAEGEEEGAAKLFGILVGWPSVEEHAEFAKSEHFRSIAQSIRDGPKARKIHHTAFKKL